MSILSLESLKVSLFNKSFLLYILAAFLLNFLSKGTSKCNYFGSMITGDSQKVTYY